MHEIDVVLKLLLQGQAKLALSEIISTPAARWLNVELPEVQNTRVDLLGETADGGLIHVELQSTNDSQMALRMAEYCLRIYRLFGKLPRQILVYVGQERLRMATELTGADLSFRYRALDIRELDGERLAASESVGDNVIAVLGRLRERKQAVRRVLDKIATLNPGERETALSQLLILAGLRQLEELVEEEARKMPVLNDIMDNKVLGREFKKGMEQGRQEGRQEGREEGRQEGELAFLRRLIEARFGTIPVWAEERLATRSATELEEVGVRILRAESLEELLK
jgi:predicted transposase YdaD